MTATVPSEVLRQLASDHADELLREAAVERLAHESRGRSHAPRRRLVDPPSRRAAVRAHPAGLPLPVRYGCCGVETR
jgi:hypothetical protein